MPARGKSCRRCNGKDHFAKMCKTKDSSKQTIKRVDSEEKNQEFAFVVKEESNMDRITFSVGGIKLPMLVDSGATSNIRSRWKNMGNAKRKEDQMQFSQVRQETVCILVKWTLASKRNFLVWGRNWKTQHNGGVYSYLWAWGATARKGHSS